MARRGTKPFVFAGLASGGVLLGGLLLFADKSDERPAPITLADNQQITPLLAAPPSHLLKQLQTLTHASAAIANADDALAAGQKMEEDAHAQAGLAASPVTEDTSAADVSWQVALHSDRVPGIPLDKNIQAYSIVTLNYQPTEFPTQGDQVTLPMFDGRALIANVKTVKTMANGDRIWTGHLNGYGDDYSVVMTYGDELTFATINTPDGNYSLEAKEGVGWLYKNPRIVDLVGADSTDFLVRDIH